MQHDDLTRRIEYSFRRRDLLNQALTHRSYGALHNERFEFLGDSVLNCVIAAELFRRYPEFTEGELTRSRASLVNQGRLHEIALEISIGQHLSLGEGEQKSGGNRRPSMLADALEALIGAIFLDGGFEAVQNVVLRLFGPALAAIDPRMLTKDAKTQLQELLQSRHIALPHYTVIATEGVAHEQTFRVECAIPELNIRTQGEGLSRRSAEQMAALRAYELGTIL